MIEKTEQKRKIVLYSRIVVFCLISLAGMYYRWRGIDVRTGDWTQSLSVWIAQLDKGGLKALAEYEGNYNMPYVTYLLLITYLPIDPLYSLKALSILFDYICAFSGGVLAVMCTTNVMSKAQKKEETWPQWNFLLAYGLILLSPVTIRNSVWWSQCDSIYVSFILLAILCMLKERYPISMILWGFAIAFKLQAVFALPFLLIYYWKNRKFSALQFLLIPLTNEILSIPAMIGGCSPFITIQTYMGQTELSGVMYNFYPNLWGLLPNVPYWVFSRAAIAGMVGLLGIIAVVIIRKEKQLDQSNVLLLFTWVTMTVLFFLPSMHERYGYLLEMLSVCLFATDKKKWYLPLVTHSVVIPYYWGHFTVESRILGSIYLIAYLLLSFSVVRRWNCKGENNA